MPASFKMDPLLAKASPVISSGSTSGIAELRKVGRTGNSHLQLERGVRMHERKNSADIKVSDKGEGANAQAIKEISLQPVVQTKVRQLCPCSPWTSMVEEKSSCSPQRTPHWSR